MNDETVDWLEDRKLDPERINRAFGLRRGTKQGRIAIRYPTPLGIDRIRFVDGEHPKYSWQRRGGKPHWYGLPQAREILAGTTSPIWVVNGEPSVWAAWQSGVPAVCTCGGEGALPPDSEMRKLLELGRTIEIVYDADLAGARAGTALAQTLLEFGADVRVRRWRQFLESHPDTLDLDPDQTKGFDVDDLHQIVGDEGLAVALVDLELSEVERADKPAPRNGSHWHVAETVLKRVQFRDGPDVVWADGSFWRYEPAHSVWREIEDRDIDLETGSLDGTMLGIGDDAKVFSIRASVLSSVRQCAIVQAADTSFFEQAAAGIQFQNGFLRPGRTTLEPSRPDLRQRVAMQVEYDASARCPMWLDALNVIFGKDDDRDDKIAMLQEFAGAILFGITGKVLFMIGEGANGKSTVIDVLSKIVPDEARSTVAPHKLSSGHQAEYWIAMLAGKRLNVDADVSARELLESAEFKKSVTGDELTARRPAGHPFSFRPNLLHMFSANELPPTRDHSHGFWRRVLVLPFNRKLDEDPDVAVVDGLADMIVAEELGGIMAWAVEGGRRLLAGGGARAFTIPDSSLKTLKTWKTESNPVALFVEQMCEEDTEHWTPALDLYQDFCRWTSRTNRTGCTDTTFGRKMSMLGFTEERELKKRTNSGYLYKIAVLSDRQSSALVPF